MAVNGALRASRLRSVSFPARPMSPRLSGSRSIKEVAGSDVAYGVQS